MKKLDQQSLENIKGGVSVWIGVAIVSAVIFIAGVIEGLFRLK